MGVEYELKFAAEPRQQQAIRDAFPGPWQPFAMETTYYDTPDGALQQRFFTLRRRLENGRSVCTLKTPEQGHGRGEWETEAASIEAAIPMLCKLGAPKELLSLTSQGVIPVCGAQFTRYACLADAADGTVELALDEGILFSGQQQVPLCEVEVEMKSATRAATAAFARILAHRYALVPEQRSKFRRALALGEE